MTQPFSYKNLSFIENFGHSLSAPAFVHHPSSVDEIHEAFQLAKKEGTTVTLRGAGRSYNDAALNSLGIVLDLQGLNKILEWNPETGVVTAEPGVTLAKLWQVVLPDGWWPPVVSGTMTTTLGGCLGMNIHGKNNFKMGTIGDHVLEFTALLPTGAQITCSPKKNGDLFRAMIGGLGMLGVFTSITLQMKKMHSGLLQVHAYPVHNLEEHLKALLDGAPQHDYIVGWLDATAGGKGLGRGQIHAAKYLHEGDDPDANKTMRVDYQTLPDRMFGVFPKSIIHYFMAPFMNNFGTWGVNTAKYVMSLRKGTYRQSHAAFHFLLDYVPNWELAYGRSGLIQYQSFLPKETAQEAWKELLTLSHARRLPSYLGVTKRHRPDDFLLSHSVDGFSLAMDFKVTRSNKEKLAAMLQEFDQIVLSAGGRFYFAKNSETTPETARRFLGSETIEKFRMLKQRTDPDNLLESDLYRRVFG
ncbi:MAG: FAD/FMN-containing dehydrogenase [Acidobacteria bacterium]|nr:FAD/FMN-containing dehydrogenase [Acidobacteriota bacterium]